MMLSVCAKSQIGLDIADLVNLNNLPAYQTKKFLSIDSNQRLGYVMIANPNVLAATQNISAGLNGAETMDSIRFMNVPENNSSNRFITLDDNGLLGIYTLSFVNSSANNITGSVGLETNNHIQFTHLHEFANPKYVLVLSDNNMVCKRDIDDLNPPLVMPTVQALETGDCVSPVVIEGTFSSANSLTVEVNGNTYTLGNGMLVDDGDNTWTLTIPNTIAYGIYEVLATASNGTSSLQDNTSDELTVVIPDAPTINAVTSDDTFIFGTGTPSDSVLVTFQNGATTKSLVQNDNTWTVQVPSGTTLVGGESIIATQINSYGCPSDEIATEISDTNFPPVAADDEATTQEGHSVTIDILGNDSDTDGILAPSTVDLNPQAAGTQTTFEIVGEGIFTINIDGTVTFAPDATFVGETTPIHYTVKDNNGLLSNEAQITITVI